MDKENLCKKTIGYIVSLTAALCLAGCASTGVITVGKDRYMISDSNSMYWDGGSVLKDIIKEGTEFCAKQNKQFEIINSGTNDARSGNIILRGQKVASAKIEFTCK